jgi:phosphosulfolactate synthase
MLGGDTLKAWDETFDIPVRGRSKKPRETGFTMVIDKGAGVATTEDLMKTCGDYIDCIKLGFGTSAFYDRDLLLEKNEIIKKANVYSMPGGTFLEVFIWQGAYDRYLQRAKKLGFSAIEVSDGTIEMSMETRKAAIKKAVDAGFLVISEVGKKSPEEKIAVPIMHQQIAEDLKNGAFKVVVEAREAGKGVGIYDESGTIKKDEVEAIVSGIDNPTKLIWEAPIKSQQLALINRFGVNVNLGNIPPEDILALEALRIGLRADTLKQVYSKVGEI